MYDAITPAKRRRIWVCSFVKQKKRISCSPCQDNTEWQLKIAHATVEHLAHVYDTLIYSHFFMYLRWWLKTNVTFNHQGRTASWVFCPANLLHVVFWRAMKYDCNSREFHDGWYDCCTHEIYKTHGVTQGGHLSPMCHAGNQINFPMYQNWWINAENHDLQIIQAPGEYCTESPRLRFDFGKYGLQVKCRSVVLTVLNWWHGKRSHGKSQF